MKHPANEVSTSYSLEVTVVDTIMEVHVTGKNTPETIIAYFSEIAERALAIGLKRLLVIEDLEGPCIGEMALYKIVRNFNRLFPVEVERIAFVGLNTEHKSDVDFTETLAQNRGVNVRVFQSAEGAREWLYS